MRRTFFSVLLGDVRKRAKDVPRKSIHTVVTSPPYYALRDYSTGRYEGGSPDCDHLHDNPRQDHSKGRLLGRGAQGAALAARTPMRSFCTKCGAIRVDEQLGLEESPEEYVEKMVSVFREVWECLRDDGTVWLNLGDSYSHGGCGSRDAGRWPKQSRNDHMPTHHKKHSGRKPKDLIGIPWLVAFALQRDGWYLRSDIIFGKNNPMPESIKDRPTRAHEYLFLLSKKSSYYYDYEAIKEPVTGTAHPRGGGVNPKARRGKNESADAGFVGSAARRQQGFNERWRVKQNESFSASVKDLVPLRNKRDVWMIGSQPYRGAHFATMPPKLVEPCVLAGAPRGGTVMDPFNGAGTVGLVSWQNGRSYRGIELNPEYVRLTYQRMRDHGCYPLLTVF
jgi:DNA modification methylase